MQHLHPLLFIKHILPFCKEGSLTFFFFQKVCQLLDHRSIRQSREEEIHPFLLPARRFQNSRFRAAILLIKRQCILDLPIGGKPTR